MRKIIVFLGIALILLFLFSGCSPTAFQKTFKPGNSEPTSALPPTGGNPTSTQSLYILVNNQEIVNNTIVIAEAGSNGPGWIVIHIDEGGLPGIIIGNAPLNDGINNNVEVQINTETATKILYAVLYIDTGQIGKFESIDTPMIANGLPVIQPFTITTPSSISYREF